MPSGGRIPGGVTASSLLACPRCRAPWVGGDRCGGCGLEAATRGGVLDLGWRPGDPDPVTAQVRAFYEERPFPDYRADDDWGSLLRRGRASGFTRELDDALPPTARVVELGCGTGQLGLFLALSGRTVLGVDLTLASLQVAESFRAAHGIDTAQLVRGDLFHPPVAPESADLVVCSGVLHHTPDPEAGFRAAVSLARPGGFVIVGLYNRYGRALLPLLRRRHAAQATDRRGLAWYADQHEHPHESRHTVGEVLGWFERAGLRYCAARPGVCPGLPPDPLFGPGDPGSAVGRLVAQLGWMGRAADGGLFVLVGRRPRALRDPTAARPEGS